MAQISNHLPIMGTVEARKSGRYDDEITGDYVGNTRGRAKARYRRKLRRADRVQLRCGNWDGEI